MSTRDTSADVTAVPLSHEDKLDEDFLFYLAYTQAFFANLEESQEVELCEAWLQKLCGQSVSGIRAKRSRNIYLSNLILGMLEGQLSGPFNGLPPKGKLENAINVFGPEFPPVDEEAEYKDDMPVVASDMGNEFAHMSQDGRTYVASKTLPNGRGAFGFISITLGEQDAKEPDPCEQDMTATDLEEQPTREVLNLLAARTPEALRGRLMRFYDDLIANIDRELDGSADAGKSVDLMLDNMDLEMRCRCQQEKVWDMCPQKRRRKMLEILKEKIVKRRDKVYARNMALDDLEALVKSQQRRMAPQEDILLQEADAAIKDRNLLKLRRVYPECVIERFTAVLKKEKRQILERERTRLLKFQAEVESDQIAIIKEGQDRYMFAKKEWVEVAEAVDLARRALKKHKEEENERRGQFEKSARGRKHMDSLIDELSREQEAYETTLKNNKVLREMIHKESQKSQGLIACSIESREKLRKDNNALRAEIQALLCEVRAKVERVEELEKMVEGSYATTC